MPVYAYRCLNCGIEFEQTQAYLDKPLIRCMDCRKNTMRRVFQIPAVIFKGSGWYSIDHRSTHGQKTNTLNKKIEKSERSLGEKNENGV
jgi:putative FmdB family regulatory protein